MRDIIEARMEDIRASMEPKVPPETATFQESEDRIGHQDDIAKCTEGPTPPRGRGGTHHRSRTPVRTSRERDEQRLSRDNGQRGPKVDRLRHREDHGSRSRSRARGRGSRSPERGRGAQRPRSGSREGRPSLMQECHQDAQLQEQIPFGSEGQRETQSGAVVSRTGSKRSQSRSSDGQHRAPRTCSRERHRHHKSKSPLQRHSKHRADHGRK